MCSAGRDGTAKDSAVGTPLGGRGDTEVVALMRLAKLTLSGFKSFADRAEFTFDEPITGVVGPNGCGKSNIVDILYGYLMAYFILGSGALLFETTRLVW